MPEPVCSALLHWLIILIQLDSQATNSMQAGSIAGLREHLAQPPPTQIPLQTDNWKRHILQTQPTCYRFSKSPLKQARFWQGHMQSMTGREVGGVHGKRESESEAESVTQKENIRVSQRKHQKSFIHSWNVKSSTTFQASSIESTPATPQLWSASQGPAQICSARHGTS